MRNLRKQERPLMLRVMGKWCKVLVQFIEVVLKSSHDDFTEINV